MRGMLPSALSAKYENCTTAEKTVLLTCPKGIQRTRKCGADHIRFI